MKNTCGKIFTIVAALLMLGLVFSGCSSLPIPTEAEVIDAIVVAASAYLVGGMDALGGTVEGVEFNTATLEVTFDGYDVSSYGEGNYSTISGTVKSGSGTSGAGQWTFKVTFVGSGAVETLSFITTSLDQAVTITALANGESFTVAVDDLSS